MQVVEWHSNLLEDHIIGKFCKPGREGQPARDRRRLGHIQPFLREWLDGNAGSAPCPPVQGRRRWPVSPAPGSRGRRPAGQLGSGPPRPRPAPGALFQGGLRGRMQTTMPPPRLGARLPGPPQWPPEQLRRGADHCRCEATGRCQLTSPAGGAFGSPHLRGMGP